MKIWEIIGSTEYLSTLGFAVRTILVGIMLYFMSRFLPRRAGGQFAGYDFIFFWMMGGLAASPLFEGTLSFINTITAIVTIYFWHYMISIIATKSKLFEDIAFGKPIVLMKNGKLIRENFKKALMPLEMFISELRGVDVHNLNEVEGAILEPSGHVSVLKKSDSHFVTPKDLDIPTSPTSMMTLLINDGNVLEENLIKLNYDRKWLENELKKNGVSYIKEVYAASIDGNGKLYYSIM